MRKCLPYNLSPFIFAPVLNVLFHFMRLESICIGRKQTDLVPNKGTRRLAFFVSNIVFVGYPKLNTPWRSRAGFIWNSQGLDEVVYKWKRNDVVSLLRKGLHNTLIVFERNVSFKELLCLEDLRYQLIIHVWRVIRERKQSLLTERTLTTLNRKFPVLNKSTDYGFENLQAGKASTSHF